MKILVLNSGSSSQKSALFDLTRESAALLPPLWEGKVEWTGKAASLKTHNASGAETHEDVGAEDREHAIEKLLKSLVSGPTSVLVSDGEIDAVGHRIVHGGAKLSLATLITPEVKQMIAAVSAIAPLHNRAELQGIDIVERLLGGVPQFAVFDTGFHRTLPLSAAVYPGPYAWYESGIRRYGFHGINHEYCAGRTAQLLRRDVSSLKIVSCHLGNGCSLAAIRHGESVDTTMGFTPLDGLMMGTRSGSVDPGILTYLLRTGQIKEGDLDNVLNKDSGLLGVSGVSSDMREVLEAARQGNARAKLAFEIFVHRLRMGIAAMAASLGGLDVLVFTGGIGENAVQVRAATCEKLAFLGIELDAQKNSVTRGDGVISANASSVSVMVISAQEDWAIAQKGLALCGRANAQDARAREIAKS